MRVLLAFALLLQLPTSQAAAEEFELPAGWNAPTHLAFDSGGRLWVTLDDTWALGRYDSTTRTGALFRLPVDKPDPEASMGNVLPAPDGTVWVGTPTHLLHLFPQNASFGVYELPVPTQLGGDLFLAGDGSVWYALVDADRLVRLDPATGATENFAMPNQPFGPLEFEPTPEGGFYLTGTYANTYAKYTPSTSSLELGLAQVQGPVGIDAQEGKLWIAEMGGNTVARVDPKTGARERYPTSPSPYYPLSGPAGLLAQPDGSVWFVQHFADRIARLDPANRTLHEYEVPSAPGTNVQFLAQGPDGAFWFAEHSKHRIGRVTFGGEAAPEGPVDLTLKPGDRVDIALSPTDSPWVALGPDDALNATIEENRLVLRAGREATGSYNVLLAKAGDGVNVGRYMRVTIQAANETSLPALPIALAVLALASVLWRRRA